MRTNFPAVASLTSTTTCLLKCLFILALLPSLRPHGAASSSSASSAARSRAAPPYRLEIIAVLADASNESLAMSKALGRALNAVTNPARPTDDALGGGAPERSILWRVKNFIISNFTTDPLPRVSASTIIDASMDHHFQLNLDEDPFPDHDFRYRAPRPASFHVPTNKSSYPAPSTSAPPHSSAPNSKLLEAPRKLQIRFSPDTIEPFCEFIGRSRPVAVVNFMPDVESERLISLVTSSAALPLIGSAQYLNPLQNQHKKKDDYYVNLSMSVRHFARALGHLLVYCHWHSFAVFLDDSPFTQNSQLVWEQELTRMKVTDENRWRPLFYKSLMENSSEADYEDESLGSRLSNDVFNEEELSDLDDDDDYEEDEPVLHPTFVALKSKEYVSAFRALSEVTKATQGVIVLLCAERTLEHVFRAAHQLRMLNGDYVFVLVGQYSQFDHVPDWIPTGVLALRSPKAAQVGKHTMRTTGRLVASALVSVKHQEVPREVYHESPLPTPTRPQPTFAPSMSLQPPEPPSGFDAKSRLTRGVGFELSKPEPPQRQKDSRGKRGIFDSSPEITHSSASVIEIGGLINQHYARPTVPTVRQRSNQGLATDELPSLLDVMANPPNSSCWTQHQHPMRKYASTTLIREIRAHLDSLSNATSAPSLPFDILNLVRNSSNQREWKRVGNSSVETSEVHLETIRWPGGGIFGPVERPSKAYRVITIVAPPFVMEAEAEDNRTCVKGLSCLKVMTNNKDALALIFADFERGKPGDYQLACCDGLAMDLLANVARELKFEIDLYLVPDGYFGARSVATEGWNGIMSALVSGGAHMSFAPLSVTSARAAAVDFSAPFFFTGVGLLGVSRNQDVPLMAFLAPFSPKLWLAIFGALNLTALVVALYEWFSPFGLNPWGRQRTKNFSMASALWVVYGRLFSHLVAYKAPKSWPNKFLINVWGGFSVIFVASYTANIAALFAGMFFQSAVDVHDRSLLSQRVAAVKHSATDFYIKRENAMLWEHIQRFPVHSFQQGVDMLNNNTLDLLIGDRPLLDYYRGTDPTCSLIDVSEHDKIGDDTYAVAMTKGFPLRESISSLVAKYIANGYMDYLQGKWYGQFACFRSQNQLLKARALGVDAVAGMFIMLGLGMAVGILILTLEYIVYKYALPYFRSQPKGTLWRSPNVMFFSQKLYRFINCVELVSPQHAAKELVDTLRTGQITSLFQKSVKRKEHEQRRRRKSKAQFFEMIQEIRRVQKTERQQRSAPSTSSGLRKPSKDTILVGATSHSSDVPPIFSIQDRIPSSSSSHRHPPKIIRIQHEGCGDATYSPPREPCIGQSYSQEHLSVYSEAGSRKASKSSIFSFGKGNKNSGSRGSLSHSMGSAGDFGAISMTGGGRKKPLKTILKRGSIAACSPRRPMSPGELQMSMNAIGRKLASPASPTPSINRLTKFRFPTTPVKKGGGSRRKSADNSPGDDDDDSDISEAEKAEILTVDLTALSKKDVIDVWKSRENDLKSKLAAAKKNEQELQDRIRQLEHQSRQRHKSLQTDDDDEDDEVMNKSDSFRRPRAATSTSTTLYYGASTSRPGSSYSSRHEVLSRSGSGVVVDVEEIKL